MKFGVTELCKHCGDESIPAMSNGYCVFQARIYRTKNRARINKNNENWKKRNRKRYLGQKQTYYNNHRETYQEYSARRRSLEKYTRTADKISYLAILERDGYWCYLCETEIMPEEISYDYVIPLSRGGTHTEENIRVTHLLCNLSKNNRLPQEMVTN